MAQFTAGFPPPQTQFSREETMENCVVFRSQNDHWGRSDATLHTATQHYTTLHNATHCYTTLHNATQRYTTLHNATQRCTTLHNATHCYTTLHNATQRYTTLQNATQRCTKLHNAAQRYTPLHTATQRCTPLHNATQHIIFIFLVGTFQTIWSPRVAGAENTSKTNEPLAPRGRELRRTESAEWSRRPHHGEVRPGET